MVLLLTTALALVGTLALMMAVLGCVIGAIVLLFVIVLGICVLPLGLWWVVRWIRSRP